MKKILLISLSLFAFHANAQFDIDQNYTYLPGDNINTYFNDTLSSAGGSGANQVWDFSKYVLNTNTSGGTEASGTTYLDADLKVGIAGNTKYYKLDGNNLLILDEQNVYALSGNEITYAPARQVIQYPLQYNVAQTNTFAGNLQGTGITKGSRHGNSVYLIDGYGKITLPGNQKYDNVVRVKSVTVFVDSIDTDQVLTTQETKYSFYASGKRIPLLDMVYTIYSNIKNGIQTDDHSESAIFYGEDATTGIVDPQLNSGPAFYPNPVVSGSAIRLDASIKTVEIYSILGALVQTYSGDDRNLTVALNSGLYIVKTTNDLQKSISAKLLVK